MKIRQNIFFHVALLLLLSLVGEWPSTDAFQAGLNYNCQSRYHALLSSSKSSIISRFSFRLETLLLSSKSGDTEEIDLDLLKTELTTYLERRKEVGADLAAQGEIGRRIGGTKGNPFLDFVSGSPNKEFTIDEAPNPFDYDELEKYGYGRLSTKIMKAGGRNAMYDLLGLEKPPPSKRLQPKTAPKLVIDKTGETDQNRYTGLKMGQVLDDDAMAKALEEANRKSKEGTPLRKRIAEEDYIMPFADKRNVSPKLTPDWTPEQLDEYGKSRGRALAWARKAKMGEFKKDPEETLDLPIPYKLYSIFSLFLIAFAFGRATPNLLALFDSNMSMAPAVELLRVPAVAIALASLGSSVVCGVILAPSKNRSTFVWAVKGLMAGPVAVSQLRGLEDLITREEDELRDIIRKQEQQ